MPELKKTVGVRSENYKYKRWDEKRKLAVDEHISLATVYERSVYEWK